MSLTYPWEINEGRYSMDDFRVDSTSKEFLLATMIA